MRRATNVLPFLLLFLLCYAYGAPELVISGAECQTTATQTYVDPWGVTQSDQTVDLYVAKDGVSIDYIDPAYGQGHNGAAIYWAVGKDILSADKWGVLTYTCEVGESLHAYVSGSTARSYAGISTSNYIIDFLVEPEYVCDSSCDPSHGCYYDGTLNNGEPTTVYVYKDTPSAHVIFLNTWNFDMPSSATEGDTITVSYPYTSAGRASTVTLYYSYDQTNWTTLATRSFDADESGTLSGSITLPRNEEHNKVWVKAHITIDDLSYNPCTTNIESAAFDIDILDASPSLTLTVTPSQPSSSDTITLTIDKVTPDPISTLTIYVDGNLQDTINSPTFPYTYSLGTLAEGNHTIEVEATEDDGDTGSVSTTISVSAEGGGGGSESSEQFPDGYQYRIPITISNSGSSDLEGYQIAIDLDSSSPVWDHAQSDLSDVMFMWKPESNPGTPIQITEYAKKGKVCLRPVSPVEYDASVGLWTSGGSEYLDVRIDDDGSIYVNGSAVSTYEENSWICIEWDAGNASITKDGAEIWNGTLTDDSPLIAKAVYNVYTDTANYPGVYIETTIPHWIESLDTTNKTAKIWVRVPKIPANGSTTIYMYYGNPDATDAQNPDAVFEFFDDFLGTSVDTSKWRVYPNSGNVSVSSSIASICYDAGIRTVSTYALTKRIVEIYARDPTDNSDGRLILYLVNYDPNGGSLWADPVWYRFNIRDLDEQVLFQWNTSGDASSATTTVGYTIGTWYKFTYISDGTSLYYYIDGTQYASTTYVSDSYYVYIHMENSPDTSVCDEVDWVRIRKYANPEPTISFGAEEASSACPSGSLNFSMTYDDTNGALKLYACPDNQIYTGGDINICTPDDSECFTITACGVYYVSVDPNTTVCYYAKYTNDNGCTYTSDVQCVDTTDQTPPTVSISLSTGTDSACYGESTYVKAEVSDNWTLPENMSVSGTIDGTSVTWTWDSSISAWKATAVTDVLGEHTVEVTATDEGGLSTTETYTYTVTDCDAPSVSIGGIDVSEDGASWEAYGGSVEEGWYVRVSASATDNVGVDHIDVYDNGELVGTISGDSGTVSWQVSGVGDHTITVRAEDTSGLSAIQETSITVVEATQPYVVATISYTPTSPTVGDTVTFTANVDSTCGEVTSYTWDLGCDGTTDGTLSTFEHTFDAEGNYCVSLTVSTDGGCTSTDSVTVTVTSVENTSGMEIDVPDNATITRFYIDTDFWYTTYITPYMKACHTFSVEGIAEANDSNYYWTAYFYLSDVNLAEDLLEGGPSIPLSEYTIPRVGSMKRCVDVSALDGISEYVLTAAYLKKPVGKYGSGTGVVADVFLIDASPVVVLLTRCPMAEYDDGVFKLTLPLRGFTGKVEWYVNGNLVRVDEVEHPDITKPTYLSYTASLAPMTEVKVRAYAKDKLGNYISPAVCTYTVGVPSPEQVYNTFSGYLQPVISKLMSPEVVYVTLSSYTPGGLAIVSAVGEKENILPYNMDWLLALSAALAILGAWAWYRRRMA